MENNTSELVIQNPCENESHTAIMSESVMKSELCDPTTREVESIHFESMREKDTMSVSDDRTCEDIFTNVIISTPSVVSCDMQVAFEEREPSSLQPASLAHALSPEDDVLVPTTSEENAIDIVLIWSYSHHVRQTFVSLLHCWSLYMI